MNWLRDSFAFRLMLIQLSVFTVSAAALVGLFYWFAHARPTLEVKAAITEEYAGLTKLYQREGMVALRKALERRAAEPAPRKAYHVLIDEQGRVLAYNLQNGGWPRVRREEWVQLDADLYVDGVEDRHEALSLDRPLQGGGRLLIGRDVEDLEADERAVRRALVYGLPALLLVVIGAGALSSRAIGARIETMSGTARRVMEGNLSERIPVRGREDDFDQLARTLNAMLDRIQASIDNVRRVSDSVAHELRTPIARLKAELSDLTSAPPRRRAEIAARAEEEAERLGRMADGVLRISRIESGSHQTDMRTVNLSDLLADAADFHAPEADRRGQTLETDIAPNLHVWGDPDLLFQAVSNLLDNALKFTPEGGSISLSAAHANGAPLVTVRDSGPGIPEELREKVSERFFRAPCAGNVPGYGLGLALVKAVAAAHESTLTLGDAGPGLLVSWQLPQTRGAATADPV